MGESVKWRVATHAGERIVRVQSAYHSGRIRLFVDEELVWNREDRYALWDSEPVSHDFQVGNLNCNLVIKGACPQLVIDGRELEPNQ